MLSLDPIIAFIVIVLCFLAIKSFHVPKDGLNAFPPGPKALPLIGNIHMLNLKRLQDSFMKLSKKYGSVFSIQIGTQKMVVLCGYKAVKDALVNHAQEFGERPAIPIFKLYHRGHGVLFSHGDNWKTMRRFTLSTLRDFGMGKTSLENKIHEECDALIKTFKSFEGKPFNNAMIMNCAVANIIVSIILGRRYDFEDPTFKRLMSLLMESAKLLGSPMVMLYNTYPKLMKWIPGDHKTLLKNAAEFQGFLKSNFTNRVDQLDRNDPRNLIDVFLIRQQEEKPYPGYYFHNHNLTILLSNLFAAGTETLSSTLRWGLLLMMKYPEIQKTVQKEINKVIGFSWPQISHRKELPYTDAVIHEIQRFANIVPNNLPHETTTNVTFWGYNIPKGTYIIPSLTTVLRDKTYFERPDEFYPEHFLNADGQFRRTEAFIPFSAGKRSCAGENLAKMELFLFFTRLLQNFTFQAPPGAILDLTPAIGITTPPQNHMICAIPRTWTDSATQ
ncbi:cytochrome P450 2K1-like isoform X1 [Pyxicephalus adspersus]|uniref:cytochrome P450 2K1-like isoform X1 n=1 Tax=Pyxicephalus adspersus TaxID=30357 RepID=UPI003B5ADC47